MSGPKVSIVVPVYNCERYLVEAITSLLEQTYTDVEIIVVDDGSTDSSHEIAAGFPDRVQVIRQTNQGQSVALKNGWAAASGSILAYLSADDRLLPKAVELSVDALLTHAGTVLVYPDFYILSAQGETTGLVTPPDYSEIELYAQLHCLPGPGAFFLRAAYERVGPWRADLRQMPDLEFFFRLASLGKFLHLPEPLACFRIHDASASYRPVSIDRAEEPLDIVGGPLSVFSQPHLVRYRRAAYANANLLSSIIHFKSGRPSTAFKRLMKALISRPQSLWSKRGLAVCITLARAGLFYR